MTTGHTDHNPEKEMTILGHLDELRRHILRALVAIVLAAVVLFAFKDFTFDQLILGPKSKDFVSYRVFCAISDALCFHPPDFQLITRQMGETFVTHLRVSFYLGLIVAFPYVFYQFWLFVKPGLYPNERKVAGRVVTICSLLFILGVLFGYYVIAPFAITFLINYTIQGVTNAPTLTSYVSYLVMFTIPTGLIFELPIVVYFLSKIGLVTPALMRKYRRHAIVLIFLTAAIITPPDPMTMFLIAMPLYGLYEASVLVSAVVARKRRKAERDEEARS